MQVTPLLRAGFCNLLKSRIRFSIALWQILKQIDSKTKTATDQDCRKLLKNNGATHRIRTDDLRITNASLYQLS